MDEQPSLDDLQMLCAVVEHGSFRAAAAALGTTQPRVSRAVQRLEARLGRGLIRRNARGVAATSLGLRYAEHAREMLRGLARAEAQLLDSEREGRIALSAPPALGRRHVVPALAEFARSNPAIRLDLSLDARRVDLIADGVDIAIRFGPLASSWRRAKRLLRGQYRVYGSAGEVRRRSEPLEALLERRPCLVLHASHLRDRWPFVAGDGVDWLPVEAALTCDDVDALAQLAGAGVGVTMLPDFLVAAEVERGELVALTREDEGVPAEVFAVTVDEPRAPRVERLLAHLGQTLGPA